MPAGRQVTMQGTVANSLLSLAVINALVLVAFVFSFAKSERHRDWRSLGVLTAFIVALFAEMFGFPLTVYVLSGWLTSRHPEIDPFAYSAGQLWHTLFGLRDEVSLYPINLLSYALIAGGFLLIAWAWRVLYQAQRAHHLAQTGPYAWIRHPQYVGFISVMFGLLIMWPAMSTLIMFPILTTVYVRLARREEQDALQQFGEAYRGYEAQTPAFLPRLR